ncbi:histidine kinase [Pleurocapsa sp. CCALA 161]|uniref:ATP-binding protein n=1 Tax=Pleurocapsa sp. CCALA 161 TaxID=2107688 RepID=UPI000D056DFB|nr:ATP-binding protein [Pleurocapsa sp. CCALA 161]PSB09187.1 histidine kinase [Pleurocapsa sp. CCALA 161]
MTHFQAEKHTLIIDNIHKRSTVELQSETYSIGRDPQNSIVLSSTKISRYHATLLRIAISGTDNYQFRIIDGDLKGRRSRNGLEVNAKKSFSHDLQNGDVIYFGDGITATYQVTAEVIKTVTAMHPDRLEQSGFFADEIEDSLATCFLGDSSQSRDSLKSHQTSNISLAERQASIQQSLERLASFPELFSNPIIEIDLQGKITYLNPAALKWFPTLRKDKLDHPILAGVIALIKAESKEYTIREINIGEQVFEQSVHLISVNRLVRCYVSEITTRKEAENLLKQAHHELEQRVKQRTIELAHSNEILKAEIAERKQAEQEIRLLQTITQAITAASSFDEAIAITLRKVCQTVNWSFAEAWIPDEGINMLKLSPSWYGNNQKLAEFRKASQHINFPRNIGKPGRVWATKKPEWTEDVSVQVSKIFLRNKFAQAAGLKTSLGVPIVAGEKVIAVFVFFDFSASPENSQIVELVKSVAAQLGLIIERKRAEDALHSSMATNKAMFNAIPDLILRINRQGNFVNFKAAKEKNLLTPDQTFLGKHLKEVFPEDISEPIERGIEKALATGELQILECQVSTDEEIYSYEVRLANSDVDEVMAIIRDITERKRAEEDVRRTLEQEKKLAELKSRFVTMASHEFRTPLASILSSAELLEHYSHKWSEEKKLSHLYRIQSSVKHMTGLLNDVLLLGKAEVGKLQLNPTKFNLFQYCQQLVEEIDLTTTTHQIVFQANNECESQSEPAENEGYLVCLDEKILRHILSNLLSNAVKYSPQGDRVDFNLVCQSEQAVFQVRDYGIGIPLEDRAQLFDSFHRATNTGSIPGTGLGLSIVKRSVDLHQGSISVDSQLGEGTTFIVILPYLKIE